MVNAHPEQRLFIGTSGWTYADWRGRFYPDDIPKKAWLSWYATQFATTEINGSFYRTPSTESVENWKEQTPEAFKFSWKASKFITHWKRLGASSRNSLELMTSRVERLERKCGPILFQLPAHFEADNDRLVGFLDMLPRKYIHVFEFRHPSWYRDRTFEILAAHGVALCISDHHDAPSPWVVTTDHVYVRGHGPRGRYEGRYPQKTMDTWAAEIRRWYSKDKTVYVYFDNDQKSAAPADARTLIKLLEP
jgi:uncharacterized protein YecE (DUF72 family)